ncbi:Serine/threonine protein kinase [Trema orientale]|uniref:Receptor-like serine/threonine-protein kinase n=1 Tax=Trema orientale TaxID=63057 RepID=A0A2P5FQV4_TREOI|nr:Serine/threonine protein kinase [Trema orientale]
MKSSFSTHLFLTFFCCALSPFSVVSDPILAHSIVPNFTATNLIFVENDGAFLSSQNGTFRASLRSPLSQPKIFYFSVIHFPTNTLIWTANRHVPISNAAVLTLAVDGLTLFDESHEPVWSTPRLAEHVTSLTLLETGNLVLVGPRNEFLWQSFDYPTDTIVVGQRLGVGKSLLSAASGFDFSEGDYRLTLTGEDLVSQWYGQTYWKLSVEPSSVRDFKNAVSFMEMNSTGLYLYGVGEDRDSLVIVMRIVLPASSFRIAHLRYDGRFMINSLINGRDWVQDLVRPLEFCQIPSSCGKLGLCTKKSSVTNGLCTCPDGFALGNRNNSCLPANNSFSLSNGCNDHKELESAGPYNYLKLGNGVKYFANDFTEPTNRGVDLWVCQDLCSKKCSCLGIFYQNSSGSCYFLENNLGSITLSDGTELASSGFIKVSRVSSPELNATKNKKHGFPMAGFVLVPLSGFFLVMTLVILAIMWLCKTRPSRRTATVDLSRWNSSSSTELGTIVSFPGLPSRFEYEELVAATKNFDDQIGSGGFGTVYKGIMPDGTVVAVKKITNLGVRGKEEFCTEIAIIGSIHHVNLVRLKGPVLEWQDRFKIVLGTARALAYLHSGCHQKIIHCDIKPENILLNDSFQVKVTDFGVSKLLDDKHSKLLTTLRGTRGYLAPEWLNSSGITAKTDVYSFGMVLLEIVSGRRNCSLITQYSSIENDGIEENRQSFSSSSSSNVESRVVYFPSLALEMHEQKRYLELADPRLKCRVSGEEIEKIVRIGLCCLHIVPTLRPTMDNVVAMLEGRVPLCEPRVEALKFLHSFGGRQS